MGKEEVPREHGVAKTRQDHAVGLICVGEDQVVEGSVDGENPHSAGEEPLQEIGGNREHLPTVPDIFGGNASLPGSLSCECRHQRMVIAHDAGEGVIEQASEGDAPVREGRVPHPDDKVELAVLEAA